MRHLAALALPVLVAASLGAGRGLPLVDAIKAGDASAARALIARGQAKVAEPDGTTALHHAAHHDNLALVNALLSAGADVKALNRYGVMPLSLAAESGSAAVVERLLKAGADANATIPGGETVLMTASRSGKADVIRVLLAHGAHVNATESLRGQTALMWAAIHGNGEAITVLAKAGADLTARSFTPVKPKGSAMPAPPPAPGRNGAQAAVKRSNARDERYGAFTAIALAARRGQLDAVRALLDAGGNVNDTSVVHPNEPPTPVMTIAIANGHYEVAAFLLERGANPNLAENGWTALHQLARARSEAGKTRTNLGWTTGPRMTGSLSGLELATRLLDKGADVNARATREFNDGYRYASYVSRIGATPLLMAARVSDAELMRLLMARGADVNAASADGMTPFMAAAGNGIRSPNEDGMDDDAPAAVRLLLDTGKVDVNQGDKRGWAPLHGAAYRGNLAVIQMLVDAGATLDVKTYDASRDRTDLGLNKEGWMPVHIADGIVNGGIFFRQVGAAALLRKLMAAKGLPVPEDTGLIRGTYGDEASNALRVLKEEAESKARELQGTN
ncbi:MAG: ankyrin repeat domain-containing protein [Vicinamibacterales bacterium]